MFRQLFAVRWSHNGRNYQSDVWGEHHANSYASALRGNGLTVTVTEIPAPAPVAYVTVAAWRRA